MVYDIRIKGNNKPIYQSTVRTNKHTDPVWQVKWAPLDPAKALSFYSISSDGRVANWNLMKNKLEPEEVIKLKLVVDNEKELSENKKEAFLYGLAGGMCFDFNKFNESLFLVGTEEGKIHLCSKAYSGQYLETYEGHYLAVYSVKWNAFHPRVFLSCSADWTIKMWDKNVSRPIKSFDLGCAVGDIEWAPYSSTVFSAVTSSGSMYVWDLS
jgi:dynein intermediate chain 1